MYVKNLIVTSTFALSLIGASIVSAHQATEHAGPQVAKHQHHHGVGKMLTKEQREEIRPIMQGMHAQMKPLIKEEQALTLQLNGKLATPNTPWDAIAPLVNHLNEVHAKMRTLFVKTQYTTFQKLGVLIPSPHPHGHFHHPK